MPDIVGITLQQRSVRGVEVRVGRSRRGTVLRTAEIPLDASTFDSGRLLDGAAFAECLRSLWQQGEFKSKRVQLVIDGRLAVVRRTELPSLGASQLRKAASYDIAELLSYPISEAVFDVDEIEQFERDGATWAKALVVAVEESALMELRTAVADAGLKLIGADLAAEALARGVDDADHGADDDRPIAILDCEDATTNIVVRDASGLLFARTLGVGVGESTISMADELESALAQLSGADQEDDGNAPSTGAGVSAVVESIRRTLSYYSAELDDRPIAEVLVAGSRGQAPGLLAALADTLGVKAGTATSAATWPNDIAIHGYETPVGAALSLSSSKTRHLELTSDREREVRTRRRNQIAMMATAIPVAGFLVISGLNARADVASAREEVAQVEATTESLSLRLSDLQSTSEREDVWLAAVVELEDIEAQQIRLGLIVREIADNMPLDTQLLSIDLQRGSASEPPPGYTGSSPAGLVTITGMADDLDGVSRWLDSVGSSDVIDGLWLEQSTYGPIGTNGEFGTLFSTSGVLTTAARPSDSRIGGQP